MQIDYTYANKTCIHSIVFLTLLWSSSMGVGAFKGIQLSDVCKGWAVIYCNFLLLYLFLRNVFFYSGGSMDIYSTFFFLFNKMHVNNWQKPFLNTFNDMRPYAFGDYMSQVLYIFEALILLSSLWILCLGNCGFALYFMLYDILFHLWDEKNSYSISYTAYIWILDTVNITSVTWK